VTRFLLCMGCAGVLALMFGLGRDNQGFTTVYVVRHAEAEQTGDDPKLTAEGYDRADTLAAILRSADLDAIYSTGLQRTLLTAAPSAEIHDMPIIGYKPKETDKLAGEISRQRIGETILIVGHSNTVPMIIASLGAGEIENIAHDEHDNLYVVTITASGNAGLQRLRIP